MDYKCSLVSIWTMMEVGVDYECSLTRQGYVIDVVVMVGELIITLGVCVSMVLNGWILGWVLDVW